MCCINGHRAHLDRNVIRCLLFDLQILLHLSWLLPQGHSNQKGKGCIQGSAIQFQDAVSCVTGWLLAGCNAMQHKHSTTATGSPPACQLLPLNVPSNRTKRCRYGANSRTSGNSSLYASCVSPMSFSLPVRAYTPADGQEQASTFPLSVEPAAAAWPHVAYTYQCMALQIAVRMRAFPSAHPRAVPAEPVLRRGNVTAAFAQSATTLDTPKLCF